MLPPTNFGRCVAVKISAEKRAVQFKQAEGPGLLDNYGHYFYDGFIGAPSRAWENFYEWGTTPIGTDAFAKKHGLTHLPRKEQVEAYLRQHAVTGKSEPPGPEPPTWQQYFRDYKLPRYFRFSGYNGYKRMPDILTYSGRPGPVRMADGAWLFLEDYWRRLSNNSLGRFVNTATEPNHGSAALSTAFTDLARDAGGSTANVFEAAADGFLGESSNNTNSKSTTSPPVPPPSFWDAAKQTAKDTGKKFQELMTDRRYAPLIALPALGLGAYGLYDLLRDKKRRKRPKFYDENAREF